MSNVVLITGASGFIGRHLARRYSNEGWHVIGIGRSDFESGIQWGINEWIIHDLAKGPLAAINTRPNLVIHCAGGASVLRSVENPHKDFLDTVVGTENIIESMRQYWPYAKMVHISSAAIYGSCVYEGVSESFPAEPVSPYGSNKYCAELLIKSYAKNFGINAVIVRLFSIYGPTLQKQLIWDACNKLIDGRSEFFGTGNEIRDWLHINDVAELVGVCANQASTSVPVVNGGSGVGVRISTVLQKLAFLLNINSSLKYTGAAREGDPSILVADVSLAKKYGWNHKVDLDSGLADYVEWFCYARNKSGICI